MFNFYSLVNVRVAEDGSFVLTQAEAVTYKFVYFGPILVSVDELFNKGFVFKIQGKTTTKRKIKLHLSRGNERYLVKKIWFRDLVQAVTLDSFLRDGTQMFGRQSVLPEKIDPFQELLREYKPKSRVTMVGNRTLKEFVHDRLR